jgi:hypothetical protein
MNEDAERQEKLAQLARLKAMGEKAYDDMYEAHDFRAGDNCYRDAKDCYYDAIGLANQLGLTDEANALNERLLHIKGVYRSQFSQ